MVWFGFGSEAVVSLSVSPNSTRRFVRPAHVLFVVLRLTQESKSVTLSSLVVMYLRRHPCLAELPFLF